MSLSESDLGKIKAVVSQEIKAAEKFHIDNELHYKQHQELEALLEMFKETRSIILKIVVGLVVVGVLWFSSIGIIKPT